MISLGIDQLLDEHPDLVRHHRLALVTNVGALNRDGLPLWETLGNAGCAITVILAPEHGHRLEHGAGETFEDGRDFGIPVHSLYGPNLASRELELHGADRIVFDLPDAGCRYFTYLELLRRVLAFAHDRQVPVVLLDRPNPLRADRVEGPVLRKEFRSTVGALQVPVRYGLTLAELARVTMAVEGLEPPIDFVPMAGYRRDMWYDETGLPWRRPSPNMVDQETAILYPGTCLCEGVNVSEGRGTPTPFKVVGAPWLEGERMADAVESLAIQGLRCRPTDFVPTEGEYAGRSCQGVALEVTDRERFEPVAAGIRLLCVVARLGGPAFEFKQGPKSRRPFIDSLLGTDRVRLAIGGQGEVEALISRYADEAQAFWHEAAGCRMY